jgi:hypothetical protein
MDLGMTHRPRLVFLWRSVLFLAVALATLAASRTAFAYPWMIRHEYPGCVPCHADPAGAGLLTEYGRAQGEILLRTRYGGVPEGEEAGPAAGFLWGAVKPPPWLLVGGSFRDAVLVTKTQNIPASTQFIEMQTDLKAQVTAGRFRASGSLGYMHEGGLPAAITLRPNDNLVSRQHWLGVDLGADKQILLRAGRIDLPFGVRQIEHVFFVRTATRTDIDTTQEHGVSLAYTSDKVRAELMGIAGNFQLGPDKFRERGYAGYVEVALAKRVALGASSLLTYAAEDLQLHLPDLRQAHGAFARASPWKPVVFLFEADALLETAKGLGTKAGAVAMAQADVEPLQGVHGILTGEMWAPTQGGPAQWAGWISAAWFFAPHADVRVDALTQLLGPTQQNSVALLTQLHLYL